MKVLFVKVSGNIAHFRKVFTNSTSLTYYFPPRTTITGMLAAAMGLERDSYYERFSSEKLDVGVEALTPLRKFTSAENYLDTDQVSINKLRGIGNRVPITKEYVLPAEGNFLAYGLYFYPAEDEFIEAFKHPSYPISLGPANMLGWVEGVDEIDCNENTDPGSTALYGAISMDDVIDISSGSQIAAEEGVPRDLDERRASGKLARYYFSVNTKPIRVKSARGHSIICGKKAVEFL